jgi:hypothetical protein
MEAEQQAQQNQAWGQAIGTGLQTAGQVGATGILANDPSIAALTPLQRMSVLGSLNPGLAGLSRQTGLFGLQQERFGLPQNYGSLMAELYGAGSAAPAGAGAPPVQQVPGEYGVSLPDQGMSQTFPEQQQGPLAVDPGMVGEYVKARDEVASLDKSRKEFMSGSHTPAEEMGFAQSFIPKYNAAQARYKQLRQSQPEPPNTHDQILQAGPLAGGATPIAGTYNYWIPDGKGGVKVSTATHPVSEAASPPVTFTASDGSTQQYDIPPGGVHFTSPPPPGTVIRRNAKGDPDVEWPPSATTDKPIDYRKEAATRIVTAAGADEPTSIDAAVKEREMEKEASFVFEIQDKNWQTIDYDEYMDLTARLMEAYGSRTNVPGKLLKEYWYLGDRFRKVPTNAPEGSFGD